MAKFKKGDTVLDKNGEWFEVKDVRSDGFIAIRMPSGAWEYRDPKEFKFLNSTISTNPVVQNALAARNAKAYDGDGRPIRVGDEVDTSDGLARIVQIKNRNDGSIHGVASYIGVSYKPNSNSVDKWIPCRTDGSVRGVKVQNALAAQGVARNADDVGSLMMKARKNLTNAYSELGDAVAAFDKVIATGKQPEQVKYAKDKRQEVLKARDLIRHND